MRSGSIVVGALACVLAGCGEGADQETGAGASDPGGYECADPLELRLPDDSCFRPGVPLDGCAPGFAHDGEYGCEPILPVEPCGSGTIAVPGDTHCRPVMDCGQGRWGDIPLEPTTEYVDAAYGNADSDGSEAKPWTTIMEAYAAAAPGALLAVAAGSYVEHVFIDGKAVRLWGVCPELVELSAVGAPAGSCPPSPLCIGGGAVGTEVHGVAITGLGAGVTISDATDVLVDRVYVHDTTLTGVDVENVAGPASVEIRDSLIERAGYYGVMGLGSVVDVARCAVRSTQPAPDQRYGRGINIQPTCGNTAEGILCYTDFPSTATLRGSLIEQNHEVGVFVMGSELDIEATVVRDTLPRQWDQDLGVGVSYSIVCVGQPGGAPLCYPEASSTGRLSGSLIERSHHGGLWISGSHVEVDRTVVRDTQPGVLDQVGGRGINIQAPCSTYLGTTECLPEARPTGTITASLVEQSYVFGLAILQADATVDGMVVQGTLAGAVDAKFGDGMVLTGDATPATVTISRTLIADSARAGLATFGAAAALGDSRIRCAAFALNGEQYAGAAFVVEDRGNNRCGCPVPDGECKLLSVGLEPPSPVAPEQ